MESGSGDKPTILPGPRATYWPSIHINQLWTSNDRHLLIMKKSFVILRKGSLKKIYHPTGRKTVSVSLGLTQNCLCVLFVQKQRRVSEEDSERMGPVLGEPRAIRPLGEYCFTDNSGGLLFPVYLSRDYPVKPRELSQRPLTPSALHCGMKRASRSRTSPCLCPQCVRRRATMDTHTHTKSSWLQEQKNRY